MTEKITQEMLEAGAYELSGFFEMHSNDEINEDAAKACFKAMINKIKAVPLTWVNSGRLIYEGTAPNNVCVRVIDEGNRVITAGTWSKDHGRIPILVAIENTEKEHQRRVLESIELCISSA